MVTLAGPLANDSNGLDFAGPFNPADGVGQARRGYNVTGGLADAGVVLVDSAGNPLAWQTAGADGEANAVSVVRDASRVYQYNGATWDRERNNQEILALALASRNGTTSSATLTNHNAAALIVQLAVTVVGSGNIFFRVNSVINGRIVVLTGNSPIITALGSYVGMFAPGVASLNLSASVSLVSPIVVPRLFQVQVAHSDGTTPWTYEVYCHLIRG